MSWSSSSSSLFADPATTSALVVAVNQRRYPSSLPRSPFSPPFSLSVSVVSSLKPITSHPSSLHGLRPPASTPLLLPSLCSPASMPLPPTSDDAASLPSLSLFLFTVGPCSALSSSSSGADLSHFSLLSVFPTSDPRGSSFAATTAAAAAVTLLAASFTFSLSFAVSYQPTTARSSFCLYPSLSSVPFGRCLI